MQVKSKGIETPSSKSFLGLIDEKIENIVLAIMLTNCYQKMLEFGANTIKLERATQPKSEDNRFDQ